MVEPTMAGGAHDQDRIWRHFQSGDAATFELAKPRLDHIIRQIARKAKGERPRVLNIGVGSGHFERSARERGWDVHALDPDRASVERLREFGIPGHAGRIEAIPSEDAFFDFVVASEVLEHLTDEQRRAGIGEIARVLKPGGWFIGTVPYNEDLAASIVICPHCEAVFHRWGHQRSFDLNAMRAELNGPFLVRELRRTALVSVKGRSLVGKAKSLLRLLLARCGQMIAVPHIYWAAQKPEVLR